MTIGPQKRWECAECGYDLTTPAGKYCPECGNAVKRTRARPKHGPGMTIGVILAVSCLYWLSAPLYLYSFLLGSYSSLSTDLAIPVLAVASPASLAAGGFFIHGLFKRNRKSVKTALIAHAVLCAIPVLHLFLSIALPEGVAEVAVGLLFLTLLPGVGIALGMVFALQSVRYREH